MAFLWHCYIYLKDAICCCRDEGDLKQQLSEKANTGPPYSIDTSSEHQSEHEKTGDCAFDSSSSIYELPAPMLPPEPISTPLPRSILVSTPESAIRRASRQTSLRFAPELDDSLHSDTPSDSSKLAGKRPSEAVMKTNGTPRRTLGEMSIAKLTSGVADGDRCSR